MRRLQVLCLALLCVVAAASTGCGEGGVASGATVSVYVAAPLCREAERTLDKARGEAGDLGVRAICLPPVEQGREVDLAAAGANARRAIEDSASVAFLEASAPTARFSQSIVESAKVAWLETSSGSDAMRRLLSALEERGSSSPREAVLKQIG
jgi:hypothetical protein